MKHIYAILIFTVVIFSFSSCRKGEDDPLISFRSRTNRLEGEWKLKSWYATSNNYYLSFNTTTHDTVVQGLAQQNNFDGQQMYYKKVNIDVQVFHGSSVFDYDTVTVETWYDYSY